MSQRNRVVFEGDSWFGRQADVPLSCRQFGGIFSNGTPAQPVFSTHLMDGTGLRDHSRRFRKFRHAKKALTKWINP